MHRGSQRILQPFHYEKGTDPAGAPSPDVSSGVFFHSAGDRLHRYHVDGSTCMGRAVYLQYRSGSDAAVKRTFIFDTWYEGSYGILAAVRNLGSPLMVIVSFIDRYSSGNFGKQLLILILTLFIMAALSWMAFCRRRSENTGKALVYTWMGKP